MAESGHGGDCRSLTGMQLKDDSDADFEIKCTPCGENNSREEAVKYCPECHEYLCTACTGYHGRLKATRSHRLLDRDNAKHSPLVVTKCLYHADRDIEMFCSTHDMVYCAMCIATEHRLCSGVNKIEDEQLSIQETKVQGLLDEIKGVYEGMKAVSTKKQNNIESLEEQRKEIQEDILNVERKITEHIRELKSKLFDSFNKDYAKVKAELESEISKATSTVQDLEKMAKQLQTVTDAGPRQQFIQWKLIQKVVDDAKMLHKSSESSGTKVFHFTDNTELKAAVTTATALGQVILKVVPVTPIAYKMNSKKEIDVHMPTDKDICGISDVCQLEDGTVLLTDENNRKVKRLDTNYNIKDHCDVDAVPIGICVISKSEVAVKMNNKIQFISVGASLSKTRCIDTTDEYYWGMTCCAGELWVSGDGGVNIYSTSGTLIKFIDKDQNGKAIFKTLVIQHMAECGDTVTVTDYSDGAVCLNRDGTVNGELRDGRLNAACGVCVTDDGTVLVCGHRSNNIVMFNRDGRCLGELIPGDAGLKNPISLCYDRNKHCIIVTCYNSNSIHIVELCK